MILALIEQGWSRRRIARELDVHRDTVARYVMQARQQSQGPPSQSTESKPAILHTGCGGVLEAKQAIPLTCFSGVLEPKPAILPTGSATGRKSQCEPLNVTIS